MVAINQIANTPCPLAEREQQIAELEIEIDRLQRTEEAIVVANHDDGVLGLVIETACWSTTAWYFRGQLPNRRPAA
jgi:hypothetical protein